MITRELVSDHEWNEFALGCQDATFYHTPEWMRLLRNSFDFRIGCLAAEDDNEIVGLLPFTVSGKGIYRVIDSLPHSDYGGPLVRQGSKRDVMLSLSNHLRKMCVDEGIVASRLTFSHKDLAISFAEVPARGGRPLYVIHSDVGDVIIDLVKKPIERIWNEEFDSRRGQRKYLRRFERDGFRVVEARNSHHLQSFYKLYWKNMNSVGGRPVPYRFFKNAWRDLRSGQFVALLVGKSDFLGSIGFFLYEEKNSIYLRYAGIDKDLCDTRYHIMTYLFWETIKWASERNVRYVHMGATPNSPESLHYRQKMGFGGVFLPQYRVMIGYNPGLFLLREKPLSVLVRFRSRIPERAWNRLKKKVPGFLPRLFLR